jgi:hypothetical protein
VLITLFTLHTCFSPRQPSSGVCSAESCHTAFCLKRQNCNIKFMSIIWLILPIMALSLSELTSEHPLFKNCDGIVIACVLYTFVVCSGQSVILDIYILVLLFFNTSILCWLIVFVLTLFCTILYSCCVCCRVPTLSIPCLPIYSHSYLCVLCPYGAGVGEVYIVLLVTLLHVYFV